MVFLYFADEAVEFSQLTELDSDLLKELIPKLGHRMKLLKYIKTLKTEKKVQQIVENEIEDDFENPAKVAKLVEEKTFFPHGASTLQFLTSSRTGNAIIITYQRNKDLSDGQRSKIIHILTEVLVNRHEKLTSLQLDLLSDDIVEIFPTETKGTYYLPREDGRKIIGGRLIERFRNQRKLITEADKINLNAKKEHVVSESEVASIAWLKSSCDPWTKVLDHWSNTTDLRKESISIHQYFQDFPCLSLPLGYTLVSCHRY